jgi:hypothetical protein
MTKSFVARGRGKEAAAAPSATDIASKTRITSKLRELWPLIVIAFGVLLSVVWSAGLLVSLLFSLT